MEFPNGIPVFLDIAKLAAHVLKTVDARRTEKLPNLDWCKEFKNTFNVPGELVSRICGVESTSVSALKVLIEDYYQVASTNFLGEIQYVTCGETNLSCKWLQHIVAFGLAC